MPDQAEIRQSTKTTRLFPLTPEMVRRLLQSNDVATQPSAKAAKQQTATQ